jgi:hypothetical protein
MIGKRLNGNKIFDCRHIGKGSYCHRCHFANTLEKMLAEKKLYQTDKKKAKPRTWTKEEMQQEVKRLRGA